MDGGASKTECALATIDGEQVALARGGPTNHEVVGYEQAAQTVRELVSEAVAQHGVSVSDVAAACFAMAGMDLPPDRDAILEQIVAPLGLSCPVDIVNDAFAGFRAGSPRGAGVCVSQGCAATFCGRSASGEVVQFELPKPEPIDARICRALLAEYQGVGPHCGFGDAYLKALGLRNLEELLWSMYSNTRDYAPKVDLSAVGRGRQAVFSAANRSDAVLGGILKRYAEELAGILVGMANRLGLGDSAFDLVLSGSVLTKGRHPALNDTLIRCVTAVYPNAEPVIVDGPPVQGAIRIARELAQDV